MKINLKGYIMNSEQLKRMQTAKGFIAALDQSGGSTPKALRQYGIADSEYNNDEEMFNLIHQMRSRVITCPAFSSEHILGAILFEKTMMGKIEGIDTADYLWEKKGIIPFLKVDKGLAEEADGVQLMKPMPQLPELLKTAKEKHIFGTKMRSVIKQANPTGIAKIIDQQFEVGLQICAAGLVPILEPEVDIHCPEKAKAEEIMLKEINKHLATLPAGTKIMFKVTIPTVANLYAELMKDSHVVRVVALSGGYSTEEADALLAKNHGLIASFSRALLNVLSVKQSDKEFAKVLGDVIKDIYDASIA